MVSQFWFGGIAEPIFYWADMSPANLARCEGYLAWKYARQSALISTHAFKNGAALREWRGGLVIMAARMGAAAATSLVRRAMAKASRAVAGTIGSRSSSAGAVRPRDHKHERQPHRHDE